MKEGDWCSNWRCRGQPWFFSEFVQLLGGGRVYNKASGKCMSSDPSKVENDLVRKERDEHILVMPEDNFDG